MFGLLILAGTVDSIERADAKPADSGGWVAVVPRDQSSKRVTPSDSKSSDSKSSKSGDSKGSETAPPAPPASGIESGLALNEVDAPPLVDSGVEPSAPAPPESVEPVDLRQYLHQVAVTTYRRVWNGEQWVIAPHRIMSATGVCIAPRRFVTVGHVWNDMPANAAVTVDGKPATRLAVDHGLAIDCAVLACDLDCPAAPLRIEGPLYLESVDVIGLGKRGDGPPHPVNRGQVTADGFVALSTDSPGIVDGDSGGGVFVNGDLIGFVRGFQTNPRNSHVCKFTSLEKVAALVAPFSPAGEAHTQPPPGADKPHVLTIISPANWQCPHCGPYVAQDWSGTPFEIVTEQRDDVQQWLERQGYRGQVAYPVTVWRDSAGKLRVLSGRYTPAQVLWSWKQTQ